MMFANYTYYFLLHVNNDHFIIMSVKYGCVLAVMIRFVLSSNSLLSIC